jgi:hypothetical protein
LAREGEDERQVEEQFDRVSGEVLLDVGNAEPAHADESDAPR